MAAPRLPTLRLRRSTPSSLPPLSLSRPYASVTSSPTPTASPSPPPPAPPRQPYRHPSGPSRVFPPRKAFSTTHLTHLLASSPILLLLGHTNLSASFLGKLRRDVARAVNPPPKGRTRLVADSPDQLEGRKPEAKLHIIRPAILTALLRQKSPHLYPIHSVLKGPVAALAYPTLDPPVLASLLRVLDRAIPRNYVPPDTGRKKKLPPRLQLLAALIGDQVMYEPAIRATATLPTLDTLRSQIVGLLSGSAGQIRGVLDAARGGRQVGLLQSYAKGLEEKA